MFVDYNKIGYKYETLGRAPDVKEKICEPESTEITITKVNCKRLNIRKSNNKQSEIIGTLECDNEVFVCSVDGEWAHIYTVSGIDGYVMKKYIDI